MDKQWLECAAAFPAHRHLASSLFHFLFIFARMYKREIQRVLVPLAGLFSIQPSLPPPPRVSSVELRDYRCGKRRGNCRWTVAVYLSRSRLIIIIVGYIVRYIIGVWVFLFLIVDRFDNFDYLEWRGRERLLFLFFSYSILWKMICTHGGYYWIFVDKEGFLRILKSFTSGLINRSSRGETNFNYLEN